MIRRGGFLVAVAVALFASPGAAWGALDVPGAPPGPLRVALLSTTGDDPLAGRLDAELRTIGIDVSRSIVSPAMGIETQVRSELAGGARAVIVADGHRTDVWIAEPGSDRVGLRQDLEVDQASGREAVLALRTVEFLRISLGLVSAPTVEPLATAPVVVKTMPSAPPPGRWMTVDVTAGALVAGSVGSIAVAGIAVRAQLSRTVGAELCVYAPLTEAPLAFPDGQVRTSVWMAGGGVLLAPMTERRMSVEVGVGALAAVMRSTGIATAAGAQESAELQVRGAIYGRGAARLRLAPSLSLRIDLFGGAVVSPPHFIFTRDEVATQTDVATWGPAFAAGLGGAELRF